MELLNIEKKQVRFIIRQLEDLRSILKEFRVPLQEDDVKKLKKEIAGILRKFRSGIFGCEERTEYRSARNFRILEEAFHKISSELDNTQSREISKLLNQARVYNAKLEKSGARGGTIEIALREAQKNSQDKTSLQKTQKLIEEAIHDDLAFEAAVIELLKASMKIKKLKGKFTGYQHLESLAMIVIDERTIVLYDQDKFHKEMEKEHLLYDLETPENKEAIGALRKEYEILKQKNREVSSSTFGFFSDSLLYIENKMVDNVIVGYCEFSRRYQKEQFLGAYEIFRIATLPGMGLFFLELVLSWAALQHAPVILDRHETSPAIRKLWAYIDTDKPYIIKYPAALSKYPEAIGYTKKEALELFGQKGLLSSTFDENGFPTGLSEAMVKTLKLKVGIQEGFDVHKSYLKRKSATDADQIIGGIASLDKAYYYDGEKSILAKLIKRGMKDKNYTINKHFKNAGHVFFQESKSMSGIIENK
ncbi:MAG: hypothetical protein Q7K45_04615 [Nanoarchaeota archaeon]|nr:hypothetical protein [Nanoarchaeota archaeon]